MRHRANRPLAHAELPLACAGTFLAILAVAAPAALLDLDSSATLMLIGSFGSTAILLFGQPHGVHSTGRAVLGGQVVSAAVGVSCQSLVGTPLLGAAAAVTVALGLMHLTGTMHAPGGATALLAVTGGPSVHALGFGYVLAPVALGIALMLAVRSAIARIARDVARIHDPRTGAT